MTTFPSAVHSEERLKASATTGARTGRLLASMCDAALKRVRGLAWRWLDLETEFESRD